MKSIFFVTDDYVNLYKWRAFVAKEAFFTLQKLKSYEEVHDNYISLKT